MRRKHCLGAVGIDGKISLCCGFAEWNQLAQIGTISGDGNEL
jgi:hypothetical protein